MRVEWKSCSRCAWSFPFPQPAAAELRRMPARPDRATPPRADCATWCASPLPAILYALGPRQCEPSSGLQLRDFVTAPWPARHQSSGQAGHPVPSMGKKLKILANEPLNSCCAICGIGLRVKIFGISGFKLGSKPSLPSLDGSLRGTASTLGT